MLKGLTLLKQGGRWRVGNGTQVSVWNDPWVPRPVTFKPLEYQRNSASNLRVANLLYQNPRRWIVLLLNQIMDYSDVQIINHPAKSTWNKGWIYVAFYPFRWVCYLLCISCFHGNESTGSKSDCSLHFFWSIRQATVYYFESENFTKSQNAFLVMAKLNSSHKSSLTTL